MAEQRERDALVEAVARVISTDDCCQECTDGGAWEDRRYLAEKVIDALGLEEGIAFAPPGFDNAVGVILPAPADPKFHSGKTAFIFQMARSGSSADRGHSDG